LDSPGPNSGRAVRRSVSIQLATVCNLAACIGVSRGTRRPFLESEFSL
jgi:hypothetical protein